MANIKSAKKKIRQDKVKSQHNKAAKAGVVYYLKQLERSSSEPKVGEQNRENLRRKAQKAIDKSAKKRIISQNRAARLISRIYRTRP